MKEDIEAVGENKNKNDFEKRNSLTRLDNSYGCIPSDAKNKFLEEFQQISTKMDDIEAGIEIYRKEISNESRMYNIPPENTISYLAVLWLTDYLDSCKT